MKQEPVAWMSESGTCYSNEDIAEMTQEMSKRFWIPLYTAPRELSDEEIMELSYLTSDNDPLDFAKAILKKASENV